MMMMMMMMIMIHNEAGSIPAAIPLSFFELARIHPFQDAAKRPSR